MKTLNLPDALEAFNELFASAHITKFLLLSKKLLAVARPVI